ncbi:hypothetical protein TcasGA2_TC034937 [Tribolium castaneum]|uniref:Uncharacterized protein n=1 Tax=Tribolium castaneum TaxID=7070 RepID=A0A139WA41_TRICA|nr:hypothetical protein TcasGA2_TC034937 [Tribolium castaneum]
MFLWRNTYAYVFDILVHHESNLLQRFWESSQSPMQLQLL